MEATEAVNTAVTYLTWPMAFAVVASVVAIVTGLFGYLMKTKNATPPAGVVTRAEIQQWHERVSDTKDRLSNIESDAKVLVSQQKELERRMKAHEERDAENVKQLNLKIDKLTDIVLKILSDDKL